MKIRLKSSKLLDNNKKPIPFYHATPQTEKIASFLPLSHFGTKLASDMRAMHFIYHALGLSEPEVLPMTIPSQIKSLLKKMTNPPKMTTYEVNLSIKKPIKINDFGGHSLDQYQRWFANCYIPKSQFLTGKERCEGDVVGEARITYKRILSDFIFVNPFTKSEDDLRKELNAESLYNPEMKACRSTEIPSFLFSARSHLNRDVFNLAEKVAFQRMIRFLEGEGYDGFVYVNEYEDKGKNSYIIFRPQQVFNLDGAQENIIPEKSQEEKKVLIENEKYFFEEQKTTSPSQRIEMHQADLKHKKKLIGGR